MLVEVPTRRPAARKKKEEEKRKQREEARKKKEAEEEERKQREQEAIKRAEEDPDAVGNMEKACNRSPKTACLKLADHYWYTGKKEQAKKYFLQACDAGNSKACFQWALKIHDSDKDEAERLYDKACEKDEPGSCYALGRLYQKAGKLKEAREFLGKACNMLNHQDACGHWKPLNQKHHSILRTNNKRAERAAAEKAAAEKAAAEKAAAEKAAAEKAAAEKAAAKKAAAEKAAAKKAAAEKATGVEGDGDGQSGPNP